MNARNVEGDSFRDEIRREVSVGDEAIHEAALEALKETGDTLSDNGINFLDVTIDAYETKNNDYIRTTFQEVASAGKEANTHRYGISTTVSEMVVFLDASINTC